MNAQELNAFPPRAGADAYLRATLALVLLAPLPAAAAAQLPERLSVEDAIALALRNNPGHLQLLNDLDVRDAQIRASYGAFLPSVQLSAGFSSTYRETQSAIGDFGEPLTQPRAIISKTSSAGQSLNLGSITLFDGGTQFRNVGIARTQRHVAEAAVANAENMLRAAVTRAYFQAVVGERRIDLERQLLAFARDRLELVRRQFEIAAARQTDLLGARVEVAQREQALANAESGARGLRLDLLRLLGVRGEPVFALVSDLPPVIDPATLDADAIIAAAVAAHPGVVQSVASAEIAEKQLANSRWSRLPRLSLGLPSYSWGVTERGLFDAWGQLGAPNNSFTFSLSASLPIFTRFQTSAELQQNAAAAEDARFQLRQRQIEVESDARAALINLERAHRSLLLAQEQADIAQLRLELAQDEYRAGATTFTALQQIIQSNDQAQRSVIDARLEFLNAHVRLEEALGRPLRAGA